MYSAPYLGYAAPFVPMYSTALVPSIVTVSPDGKTSDSVHSTAATVKDISTEKTENGAEATEQIKVETKAESETAIAGAGVGLAERSDSEDTENDSNIDSERRSQEEILCRVIFQNNLNVQPKVEIFSCHWNYYEIKRQLNHYFGSPEEGKIWKIWMGSDSMRELSGENFPPVPPKPRPIEMVLCEADAPELQIGVRAVYADFNIILQDYKMEKKRGETQVAAMRKLFPHLKEGTYAFFIDMMSIPDEALYHPSNNWLKEARKYYYRSSLYGGVIVLAAKKMDEDESRKEKATEEPFRLANPIPEAHPEQYEFAEPYINEQRIESFKEIFTGKANEVVELQVVWIFKLSEEDEKDYVGTDNPFTANCSPQKLRLRFSDYAENYFEIMESKPPPGLKASFDLKEASAKVITLMARVTMTNKWERLSKTSYGFFIRTMLLSGSKFDDQVVEDTKALYLISFLAVFLSAGMQFVLCWRLWAGLPVFPRDEDNNLDPFPPHLLPIWHADNTDLAYSVCRTNSLVQIVCIGLFLLYALYSVPTIIKDILIICTSHRFISEDVDGVTRIHYWRTESFGHWFRKVYLSRSGRRRIERALKACFCFCFRRKISKPATVTAKQDSPKDEDEDSSSAGHSPRDTWVHTIQTEHIKKILQKLKDEEIDLFVALENIKNSKNKIEADYFDTLMDMATDVEAPNIKVLTSLVQSAKEYRVEFLNERKLAKERSQKDESDDNPERTNKSKQDIQQKFRDLEKYYEGLLKLLEPASMKEEEGIEQAIERIRLLISDFKGYQDWNQILLDFELKEMVKFFRNKLAEINPETFAYDKLEYENLMKKESDQVDTVNTLKDVVRTFDSDPLEVGNQELLKVQLNIQVEAAQTALADTKASLSDFETKMEDTKKAASNLVRLDYCDDPRLQTEWARRETGYYAINRSVIALIFGVIPQLLVTLMLLITGVEYIMWSGSKIASDTGGNEEIILATVAIVFINDIDDFMYEHILPELYKTSHERDQFNLLSWVQSDEPMELATARESYGSSKINVLRLLQFFLPKFSIWPRKSANKADHGSTSICKILKMTKRQHDQMSRHEIHVADFAKHYPILYARKHKYFFATHFIEFLVWVYGLFALHPAMLAGIALAIVAGFRTAHDCGDGLQGVFSTNPWPSTCDTYHFITTGQCI